MTNAWWWLDMLRLWYLYVIYMYICMYRAQKGRVRMSLSLSSPWGPRTNAAKPIEPRGPSTHNPKPIEPKRAEYVYQWSHRAQEGRVRIPVMSSSREGRVRMLAIPSSRRGRVRMILTYMNTSMLHVWYRYECDYVICMMLIWARRCFTYDIYISMIMLPVWLYHMHHIHVSTNEISIW